MRIIKIVAPLEDVAILRNLLLKYFQKNQILSYLGARILKYSRMVIMLLDKMPIFQMTTWQWRGHIF